MFHLKIASQDFESLAISVQSAFPYLIAKLGHNSIAYVYCCSCGLCPHPNGQVDSGYAAAIALLSIVGRLKTHTLVIHTLV